MCSQVTNREWGEKRVQRNLVYSLSKACQLVLWRAELGIQGEGGYLSCFPHKILGHLVLQISSLHYLDEDKTGPGATADQSTSAMLSHSLCDFCSPDG